MRLVCAERKRLLGGSAIAALRSNGLDGRRKKKNVFVRQEIYVIILIHCVCVFAYMKNSPHTYVPVCLSVFAYMKNSPKLFKRETSLVVLVTRGERGARREGQPNKA